MNALQPPKSKIQSFGVIPTVIKQPKQDPNRLAKIFKELAEEFKKTIEIGRFDKIKAEISEPLNGSVINKAFIILEPSANKSDFRTRVLSFVAQSPSNENIKRSICQATGNKFAIDSVLKNPSTITAFKNFIRDSEKFFT